MNVWNWILSALLFILALGVLITIHELGHLSMAKLFNVYCQEFSIGFGPALIKKRKKGKETYFCLRAIPLGGYVMMYGEGSELEKGVVIPESRSLEGIKKWKKAIILSAGIILNVVLSLTLIGISNLCFPLMQATTYASVRDSSIASEIGIKQNDEMLFYGCEGERAVYYEFNRDNKTYAGYLYIVDTDVDVLKNNGDGTFSSSKYVLTYYPTGNKKESAFSESVILLPVDTTGEILKQNATFSSWANKGTLLANYPDYRQNPLIITEAISFTCNIHFAPQDGRDNYIADVDMHGELKNNTSDQYVLNDVGLSFQIKQTWLPFLTRVKNTFVDFGNASIAVFKGIASLFSGGIGNMSGIVGIFSVSASILSEYTFASYLYFWGLISVNLAIFNLLPFPGLDGWALLVTAIEGITRKKIPLKVKSIVSTIGLVLLFGFMIVIVVLDILRLVGVII